MKKILMILSIFTLLFSVVSFATEAPEEITPDVTITVDQFDEVYQFTTADFTTAFNTLSVGDLTRVVIATVPDASAGALKYNGDDITTLPFGIPIENIDNLEFIPDSQFTGDTTFTWRGKTAEASNPKVFTTQITVTNELEGKIVDITVYKNEKYTFKATDFTSIFNTLDVGDLSRVVVASLPTEATGILKYNDAAIATLPLGVDLINVDKLTFEPATDFLGKAIFTWRGKTAEESNATVFTTRLTVIERPSMVAKNKTIVTEKNTTVISNLESQYAEGAEYVIVLQPKNGTISNLDKNTGTIQFTPAKDYVGEDMFTFKMVKGDMVSNVATVTVQIKDTEPVIPFHYVDMQTHWANYSASHLADMGIIVGEKINNEYFFYPDRIITRGDFVLSMLSTLGYSVDDVTTTFKFEDDKYIDEWMKPYIYKAYETGLIKGSINNGKIYFYPDKYITRAEVATIINNSLKLTNVTTPELTFTDSNTIPGWSIGAIKNMVGYKIISGYDDNTIKPTTVITKAELAEILYKTIKEKQKVALEVK